MTRPVSLCLVWMFFMFGCFGQSPLYAGPEQDKVVLVVNEEYVGQIDHKQTRYLKLTLVNLAEEPAVCRISFYKESVELGVDREGPVEFRTFTLEKQNDSQTRIWTTLNFDEFILNVTSGEVGVTVEKSMQMR